jgi:hypothetical protein
VKQREEDGGLVNGSSPASLAANLGSWFLLLAVGVTAMQFPGLVGNNSGWRWQAARDQEGKGEGTLHNSG